MNDGAGARQPRSRGVLIVLALSLSLACAGLCALGVWQVQRRAWKLDLIERVDTRIHAAPVAAPAPSAWPGVSAVRDEYRHVRLEGRFLPGRDTRVQALTVLGAGFWVLSPLRTDDGAVVLVNRGFVPDGDDAAAPPAGRTQVTGLLRLSEPQGGFLRRNAPAQDRWYSRDVSAIAHARGLDAVAPYFVDADAAVGVAGWPRAGLTVTRFSNNHLGYALTWFALAAMVAGAGGYLAREEWKLRRRSERV